MCVRRTATSSFPQMISRRRFVLHVPQRGLAQTHRETRHLFALFPVPDKPPPIAPCQRCSEFETRGSLILAISINRRADEGRVRKWRTKTTRSPLWRVCQSSPIIAGCVHAQADLVLEFVPDCKLINANRRYHLTSHDPSI